MSECLKVIDQALVDVASDSLLEPRSRSLVRQIRAAIEKRQKEIEAETYGKRRIIGDV